MSLSTTVNSCLDKMKEVGGTAKGTFGEIAVFQICEELYQKYGGILYLSYTYKVDRDLPGNIKKNDQGRLYLENLGATTEVDVLLVTPYKVFPIEVKAYKSREITLTDEEIIGCYKIDKSPIHQNEMHSRHLYSSIFKCLPDGMTKYILPIVVFVDEATIVDNRSKYQKDYIKTTVLNQLKTTLITLNKPSEFRLDLKAIDQALKNASTKYERLCPLREI